MNTIADELVEEYYNTHVDGKIKGFTDTNPRIELAWKTIVSYAPDKPAEILEVGCGIGDICHRMGKKWKNSNVTGIDISSRSIEVAARLFGNSRTRFIQGYLEKDSFKNAFDLIVLMDVYEHIKASERPVLHEALRSILKPGARIILSCPTPRYQEYLRNFVEGGLQPVDEDITSGVAQQLSEATGTELILYREVQVWHPGDYVHIVLVKDPAPWHKQSYLAGSKRSILVKLLDRLIRPLLNNPVFSKKASRMRFIKRRLRDQF